jgi:hypothetical protein
MSLLLMLALQDALPGGADLRPRLDRILSSQEYSTDGPAQGNTDVVQSILRWVQNALASLTRLGQRSPLFLWIVLLSCLLILGAIVLHAAIILSRALREARSGRGEGGSVYVAGTEDPMELLERAREEARRGRAADAARLSHRASVAGLGRRGLLRLQETLTTGDCRRQLATCPRDRETFDSLVRIYEPAWFGKAPVSAAELEACLSLAAQLVRGSAP